MYAAAAQAEATQADQFVSTGWTKPLDRVDVYPGRDGYTATVLRHDETGEPSLVAMRSGRARTWRDLDNLVSYVLRNVSNQPSIHVHIGARK